MKRLLLLRHAKAEQPTAQMADAQRPLAERGHRDVALLGRALVGHEPPDLALCSPALRTRETLDDLVAALGRRPHVVFNGELYTAPTGDYLEAIRTAGGDSERLLVVGHNPTIHRTALLLAGSGKRTVRTQLAEKFPTGALAMIALPIDDWAALSEGCGTLELLVFPSELRKSGREH